MTDKLDELLADEPEPVFGEPLPHKAARISRNEFRAAIRSEVDALRAERDRLREALEVIAFGDLPKPEESTANEMWMMAMSRQSVAIFALDSRRAALSGEGGAE